MIATTRRTLALTVLLTAAVSAQVKTVTLPKPAPDTTKPTHIVYVVLPTESNHAQQVPKAVHVSLPHAPRPFAPTTQQASLPENKAKGQ